jgi:hypothetical protein
MTDTASLRWKSRPSIPDGRRVKRIRASLSLILTAVAVVILLSAVPSEIQRFLRTGSPYLLTNKFFSDILARFSGPGRFRFIIQPLMAVVIGIRDGRRDAREGRPPFLLALVSGGRHKKDLLRGAFASVRNLVAIAIILDVISQYLIFREIHPGAALLVGPLLIAVPYALSRAFANRISQRAPRTPVAHPS